MTHLKRILLITLLVAIGGCASKRPLIPAPYINLTEDGRKTFDSIPAELRTPEMDILYAADRSIEKSPEQTTQYGTGRNGVLTIGVARVGFDRDVSWDQLVKMSTTRTDPREDRPAMQMKSVSEYGVLAVPLNQMEVSDGRYVLTADARKKIDEGRAKLYEVLKDRLSKSPKKDVFIFVHGFNNTFQDAVFRLSMAWHMAGRPGVAIAYTWPAGHGGLTGYAYDRESGEFTVSHLRRFIKVVAACEDVEHIHLVAHSRGTDVVVSAIRELNIECKAQKLQTREVYKLEDLVLAAPDLNADVFEQRFAIEDLHLAATRTTVYLSRADYALAASRWVFGGGSRLGNLRPEDFTEDAKLKLSQLRNFYLIDCNVTGYSSSHDYAFVHPAVVSDLILLLRDGKTPGASRPLGTPFDGIWDVKDDYLQNWPPKSLENKNVEGVSQ